MSSIALAAASAVAALAIPQPQLSVNGSMIGNRHNGDLLTGNVVVTAQPGVLLVSSVPSSLQNAQDAASGVGSPFPLRVRFAPEIKRSGIWRAIGDGRFQQENKAGTLIRGKTFKPTPADLAAASEVKPQQPAA